MGVKLKLFYDDPFKSSLDVRINEFLSESNREYVDIKLIGVEETDKMQTNVMAILVYRTRRANN